MSLEIFLENLEKKLLTSKNPRSDFDKAVFFSDLPFDYKKKWLKSFIKREFDIDIPSESVCEHHCAPLDFIADVVFQRVRSALVLANRDGGKTYDFAIIHAINSLFYSKCETVSVGAVEEQAKKCYSYYKQFIKSPAFADIYNDPLTVKSELKNGSSVAVLPGTMNALNSPHPHKSFFDEVELTKLSILQEFFSMSKSDKESGIKNVDILGSTRKFSYGIMQNLIDAITDGTMVGWKIYQWCIWEVAESFELDDEWKKIKKRTKEGEVSFYDIAKPYAGRTNGFYPIEDIISKFSNMSYETWETQWVCKKPSKEGLVYGAEFDEERDILPDEWVYNPDYPVYAGQDFGDTDPMVTLYYQLLPDGKTLVLFDEVYQNKISASKYAKTYLIPRDHKYNTVLTAHDPSGAGYAREIREARDEEGRGVNTFKPHKIISGSEKSGVEASVQLVKTLHESHRIKVSPNCKNYIKEKRNYHYLPESDKIADEDNHCMDAERYITHYLFGEKEQKKQEAYGLPIFIGSKHRLD